MHILILAGGGGTRLWPLSRNAFPKQFLHFGDQESLLQKTVSRFLHAPRTKSISISTNAQCAPLVKQQLAKIPGSENIYIIIEPLRKNTAPAIAFAVKYLQEELSLSDRERVLVLPSDHLIEPEEVFLQALQIIEPLVSTHLVLFGIAPTKPETGYGYIQIGETFVNQAHRVKRFVEKPNHTLASAYLASGDYAWNAGMFAFSIQLFWQQLAIYAPDIFRLCQPSIDHIRSHFDEMPDISFDYGILEKTPQILVCPLLVNWSDVGCWDSVYDVMKKDSNQNVKFGNVLDLDTKNSLIIGGKRLITTIGLENMIIVETDDAIFIGKKGESQKVKQLVQSLLDRAATLADPL